jgi:NAD(P)-dependent dehydrogenase (short-subunit alcohol dehydrogenase family)
VADLADPEQVEALLARVLAAVPHVDLLVNNAGVALGGDFVDLTAEEFDWVQAINFRAPVALCRGLLTSGALTTGGHVLNVSSLFGLIGPPGQSAYSSSKFALRGFSEVLRHELAPRGIGVTSVHPGGVRTRIAETARVAAHVSPEEAAAGKADFARLLTYPADKAAARMLDAVQRRRGRVLVAFSAVVPDLVARVSPTGYMRVLDLLLPRASRRARGLATGTPASVPVAPPPPVPAEVSPTGPVD